MVSKTPLGIWAACLPTPQSQLKTYECRLAICSVAAHGLGDKIALRAGANTVETPYLSDQSAIDRRGSGGAQETPRPISAIAA